MDAMGATECGDQPALTCPPGYRFHPSEDQLFRFYLMNKNTDPNPEDLCNVIKELDMYGYFPPELPDAVCFPYGSGGRKRHWYCYTLRVAYRERRNRRTRGGFWRRRGAAKVVAVDGGSGENAVWGTRTRFVFYAGDSAKTAIKTDWVMSEYALADHFTASFVLCRVSVKANGGNIMTSKVMASRGMNSGPEAPDLREELSINIPIGCMPASSLNDHAIPELTCHQFHMDNQLEDHGIPEPIPEVGHQFLMDNQLDNHSIHELVPEPGAQFHVHNQVDDHVILGLVPTCSHFYMDPLNELVAILEGDYIELDDLGIQ
ncbi:hypothetical protein SAY86_006150 [Trapa natans]|uniref:NAC domain-containing protein n=1 Tax=Trapa natans TaxID=22666 RepID=A0AAN7QU19_TRANT|nr:hypothetical protein SAY86_006150 [Trapa natans]